MVVSSVSESAFICARVNLQRLKLIAQVKPLKSDELPPEDSVYKASLLFRRTTISSNSCQDCCQSNPCVGAQAHHVLWGGACDHLATGFATFGA